MKNTTLTITLAASCLIGLSASAQITLVAAWEINEGSGTTITEATSSTASDNLSSFTTWGTASTAPGSTASLTFDGSNGENVPQSNVSGTSLAGTGAKTFVAWINPTAGDSSILSYSPSHGTGNGQDLRFLVDPSGFLRAEVSGGFLLSNAKDFRNDGWNMVAVIFDGNTDTSSFYVGGTGLVTPSSSGSREIDTGDSFVANDPTETLEFVIGGDPATRSFTGGLDMVAVYEGAASLSELNDIYTNGVVVPEPGTYALLFGMAGLGLVMWRRRRA